jgi:hypothetical protein
MDQSDRGRPRINNVNGGAVSHVDTEQNATLICDKTVAARKCFVGGKRSIDYRDVVPVHLFRGDERQAIESEPLPDFLMDVLELLQCFRLVTVDGYSRNALDKRAITNA